MNLALNTKIIEPENKNEIDNAIILLHENSIKPVKYRFKFPDYRN